MDIDGKIASVVRDYVDGMIFDDEAKLRSAFYPAALIAGNFGGALEWLTLDAFVQSVHETGAAAPGTVPDWSLVAVDVTDDAATVKLKGDSGGMTFTDYLSLLKIDGRWAIVHKIYHHHA